MIKYSGIYEASTPPPSTKSLWVDGGILKIYKNGNWEPVDDSKSKLTIDSSVKEGSTNPVSGGAVHTALMEKANSSKVEAIKDNLEALATKIDKIGTLRDLYISAGAKYNEETGYYELNGITDIGEEEMREIYSKYLIDIGTDTEASGWLSMSTRTIRTNLPSLTRAGIFHGLSNSISSGNYIEVLNIGSGAPNSECYVGGTIAVAHNLLPKLREVIGIWRYNDPNPDKFNFGYGQPFSKCPLLEEIKMSRINKSHTFAESPRLSKASVLYMIANANPPSGAGVGSIAITLHPTVYTRLINDEDIINAIKEKEEVVTIVSA